MTWQENLKARRRRWFLVFTGLFLALLAAGIGNIMVGSVPVSAGQIPDILLGRAAGTEAVIIRQIRLPRYLMAVVLGGALAVAGFLLQTYFANPIAGPFVLGISSGARLAVAAVMTGAVAVYGRVSSWTLILAALAGALAVTGFILLIAARVEQVSALLVGGIMVGYICSALTDFIITFADNEDIVNLHGWSRGSFSGAGWETLGTASAVSLTAVAAAFLLAKPIGAYLLGENYAASVGVDTGRFRIVLILLSGILSACVTAFAGPVSFVGVAVPFLIRGLLKTAKPVLVIPGCFLGGAVFCSFCDLLARTAAAPMELNISTVTAVFGAPVVVWMLISRRGR